MSKPSRPNVAVGAGVLLVAAGFGLATCRRGEPLRPVPSVNVVLISLDTLRADRLNCYGYKDRTVSPNIDALARDGIVFEKHITTAPWTTPAHLSLLTSLHPSSHGVTTSFRELITRVSQNGQYSRLPDSRLTLAEALFAQGHATAAFTAGITMDPKIGFAQGFSSYDTSMVKLNRRSLETLEGWLDRNAGKRFFLFWHTFEVHAPYLQTTFLQDVLPAESARAVQEDLARRAEIRAANDMGGYGLRKVLKAHGVFTREVCDALYMGGVRSADRWVGEFLEGLRARGLYDETLIVLTSDHGEELGLRSPTQIYDGHGHSLYEELVHVPLIVKLPRQRYAGQRLGALSSAVDVMPTILDVLSISLPGSEMQGRSLRPAWEGAQVPRLPVYCEALGEVFEKKALRDERYKYVLSISAETVARSGRSYVPADAERELYDLQEDPGERNNLLKSPRAAELASLAARLDEALRAHLGRQKGKAEGVTLDPETIEKLKGLGYIQ